MCGGGGGGGARFADFLTFLKYPMKLNSFRFHRIFKTSRFCHILRNALMDVIKLRY